MRTIKSKRWYDQQIRARENLVRVTTDLYRTDRDPPIKVKNYIKKVDDEINTLRTERDLYHA